VGAIAGKPAPATGASLAAVIAVRPEQVTGLGIPGKGVEAAQAGLNHARRSIRVNHARAHRQPAVVVHRVVHRWVAEAVAHAPAVVAVVEAVVVAVGVVVAVVVVDKGIKMNKSMNKHVSGLIALAIATALGISPAAAADEATQQVAPAAKAKQQTYASPEDAAQALYAAVKSDDVKSIYQVLGPGSAKLVYTGDPVADHQMRDRFVAAYDKALKIEKDGDAKALLLIGEHEFPFPFPLIKSSSGWRFDARAGADEIVNRRIGENELFAIKFCLAYGDAQREYAEFDRDGDGLLEYAQKFKSSEGKRDGLFWPTAEGEPPAPLGPLAAQAKREGYSKSDDKPIPYHGYFYRILTGQGKDAPGGAYDYLVKGNMIGGYALIAYPAKWGVSGVMSFMCSHDGVVYQKNLGAESATVANKIKLFNPGADWSKAE